VLVGGRIIPSFTRNWLARAKGGRLPKPFGRFDAAAIFATALALAAWTLFPTSQMTGALLSIAGVLQACRLARWAGDRTVADRLIFVLHAAYAFIPTGLLLLSAASFQLCPQSAGIHALAAGGVGLMTLAVMSRVSLGHSGRKLVASRLVQASFACIWLSAALRVAAAFAPSANMLLHATAAFWIVGFAIFIWSSWRMLVEANR
ncbi:MAG: heme-Cu protein NnrS, partial [Hyphomicrobiales bacterium]|nr:heme-Cu protein NnrS [Hyphomicrobiales bacterium]